MPVRRPEYDTSDTYWASAGPRILSYTWLAHRYKAFKLFPGHVITLTAITELDQVRSNPAVKNHSANPEAVLPEIATHMAPTGVPLHKLCLKIGAPVMIIRNVCHPHLLNGRVLIVKALHNPLHFSRTSWHAPYIHRTPNRLFILLQWNACSKASVPRSLGFGFYGS
jgi:hypothetical protein